MRPCAIFLDVDGVLNSLRSLVGMGGLRSEHLDPVAIGLLQRLVKELEAEGWRPDVVISSTWRMNYPDTDWWVERLGVPVIGMTPVLAVADLRRGHEVDAWLEANGARPFVCLDDDQDFLPRQPLVVTRFEDGLRLDDIDRAFRHITGHPIASLPRIVRAPDGSVA